MAGKIVLVTGGARSGKSVFAERYAAGAGEKVAYIATAQILDDEMQARVALHRERRGEDWPTWEAPFAAAGAMREAAAAADAVLFDCLTLYVSNLLLGPDAPGDAPARRRLILGDVARLLETARQSGATVVFVTNEVGLGIVPDNALAREYRDVAGLVNQQAAAAADEVYLVISGLAVELKKLAAAVNKEV